MKSYNFIISCLSKIFIIFTITFILFSSTFFLCFLYITFCFLFFRFFNEIFGKIIIITYEFNKLLVILTPFAHEIILFIN